MLANTICSATDTSWPAPSESEGAILDLNSSRFPTSTFVKSWMVIISFTSRKGENSIWELYYVISIATAGKEGTFGRRGKALDINKSRHKDISRGSAPQSARHISRCRGEMHKLLFVGVIN